MASVRLRGKKGVFYALWWISVPDDSGGRKQRLMQKPTGKTNRKEALEIAERWELESKRPAHQVTLENTRRVLADVYKRAKGKDAKLKMRVCDFATRWLRSKRVDGVEDSTLSFYKHASEAFVKFLNASGRGEAEMFEITPGDVADFRNAQAEILSKTTVNHQLKCVRMMFTAARLEGWLPDNPCEGVKPIEVKRRDRQRPAPFTLGQIERLLGVCDAEWTSMVMLGFYTSRRLGDIARLLEGAVDLQERIIKFTAQKTDTVELVPMHPDLHAFLMERDFGDDLVRPMHPRALRLVEGSKRKSVSSLSKQFEHLLLRAGLRERRVRAPAADLEAWAHDKASRRRARHALTFHSLRHTMTTELAKAAVDRRVGMELVGHSSEQVHEGYTHLPLELLREGIARLPGIGHLIGKNP